MHRGERFAWILFGVITATLVLMGTAIYTYGYVGERRVAKCREDLAAGVGTDTEAWVMCDERGDWGGN